MSEQSSTPSRETSSTTQQRKQALRQLLQQIKLFIEQNQSLLSEPIPMDLPMSERSREVVGNTLEKGVRELFLPTPSPSSIQQPDLQTPFQEFRQGVQGFQQRYPDTSQYVIPLQTNQQYSRISQQPHAEQLYLPLPVQRLQQLYAVNPENTNTQVFLQVPQLQPNSNASSIASEQLHMQGVDSFFLQPFQQSAQNVQRQNPQGNHLLTEISQQTNYSQQALHGSQLLQQHHQGNQSSFLQLPQQIPTPSLQPLLQQARPLIYQSFQQYFDARHPPPLQQNQRPLFQLSQQPMHQEILVQQIPHIQLPLAQQPPNQAIPSFLSGTRRETAQFAQQMQCNQSSISLEESVPQGVQQMFRQMPQQSVLEPSGTNSVSTANISSLAQLTQQQSNQQRMIQQSQAQTVHEQRTQLSNGDVRTPWGISQVSEPQLQLQQQQQSSETVQKYLEIPDVSLFSLAPQHFMQVIRQQPYDMPSDQAEPSRQPFLQSYQSDQQPPSSLQEGSSAPLNQSPLEGATSLNQNNSSEAVLNDGSAAPNDTNELFEIVAGDDCDDKESVLGEISVTETNTSPTSVLSEATTESRNSDGSQETATGNDFDSIVAADEGIKEINGCLNSHPISAPTNKKKKNNKKNNNNNHSQLTSNRRSARLRRQQEEADNTATNRREISHRVGSRISEAEMTKLRKRLEQILRGDVLITREIPNYLDDQTARIESLRNLLNSTMSIHNSP